MYPVLRSSLDFSFDGPGGVLDRDMAPSRPVDANKAVCVYSLVADWWLSG